MNTRTPRSALSRFLLRVLGVVVLLIAVMLAIALVPLASNQFEADLTRFLWTDRQGSPNAQTLNARFAATAGPATVLVRHTCNQVWPEIRLNDAALTQPETAPGSTEASLTVTLETENRIDIRNHENGAGCTLVRVRQRVSVETHVLSRVHFNTNVSSFQASRAFYGMLGFETLSGFPDTNTQAMARAIGIETPTSYDGSEGPEAGGYLLHGELIGPDGFAGGVIDLIEFTIPRNDAPPYGRINRLGMTRAVMYTSDIDADHQYLSEQGVQFLSAPVLSESGDRVALFTDPDGTFYELREALRERSANGPPNIFALGPVGINVSDFERSIAWYRLLGFSERRSLPDAETSFVAQALGFDQPISKRAVELSHSRDDSRLEISQWLTPYDPEPPYPVPVNHLGIHRMAFSTSDIEADVAMLKAQGVEFVSDITPCCSGPDSWGSIVAFYDPDGTVLELVEQPFMTPLFTLSARLAAWLQ